jgi:hypothetical protein
MANDLRRVCFLALACLIVGCTGSAPSYSVPDRPDQIILYSIDGNDYDDIADRPRTDEAFHTYPVLGKVEITDIGEREEILATLKAAGRDPMFKCFWPRHGIRIQVKGAVMDYLICFECYRIRWHCGEKSAGAGLGVEDKRFQTLLNDRLRAAGVALAKGAEKR